MGIEVKSPINYWEVRRLPLARAEPKDTYIALDGMVLQVLGRIKSKKGHDAHALLCDIHRRKKYYMCNYGYLSVAIKQKRLKPLSEMEVLAWAAK